MNSSYSLLNQTGLQNLQTEARRDPKNALRQAAEQFEAVFLNQMLKSMRDTVSVSQDESLFDSSESKTFQGLLDQQWAGQISRTKGLGIADMIVRQLSKDLPGAAAGTAAGAPAAGSPAAGSPAATVPAAAAMSAPARAVVDAAGRQDLPVQRTEAAAVLPSLDSLGGARAAFVQRILPHARAAAERLGVAPELVIAHAALETGWGRRLLGDGQDGGAYNLFGIKAGRRWNGAVTQSLTTEYENGAPSRRVERFRAYDGFAASFRDYADLLSRPRFAAVKNTGSDAGAFARALQAGGYATDPNYARKLEQVASNLLKRI